MRQVPRPGRGLTLARHRDLQAEDCSLERVPATRDHGDGPLKIVSKGTAHSYCKHFKRSSLHLRIFGAAGARTFDSQMKSIRILVTVGRVDDGPELHHHSNQKQTRRNDHALNVSNANASADAWS